MRDVWFHFEVNTYRRAGEVVEAWWFEVATALPLTQSGPSLNET